MLCRSADDIPAAPGLVYEPKWDGFRCIVFRDGDTLHLESRNSLPLQRYFPELIDPLRSALPEQAVVDGEIVIAGPRGLDFDALQLRRRARRPSSPLTCWPRATRTCAVVRSPSAPPASGRH